MSLMSQMTNGARTRVPRFAEAAVERARLTVVPQRSLGRTRAGRMPFAVLVIGMLVAGVIGLLTFNTNMQQDSFTATTLQNQVTDLTAQQQSLTLAIEAQRNPQNLAAAAKKLGMVEPSQPAFIELATGRVLGQPVPATRGDAMRINPLPNPKPASLQPKPIIIHVPAPATGTSAGTTSGRHGAASTTTTHSGGRKKATTPNAAGATQ